MEEAEVDEEDFWLLGGVSQNDGGNREVGRAVGCPRTFPEKNLYAGYKFKLASKSVVVLRIKLI